jgi:hypothetical protein
MMGGEGERLREKDGANQYLMARCKLNDSSASYVRRLIEARKGTKKKNTGNDSAERRNFEFDFGTERKR